MSSKNENVKKKGLKEFDIRDVGYFILKKSWIIAIAAFVCLVFAIGYTALIPEKYVTNTRTFLIAGDGNSSNAWAIGERTVENTPTLIDGNAFCVEVASILNNGGELKRFFEANPTIKEKLNTYLGEELAVKVENNPSISYFLEGGKTFVSENQVISWISAAVAGKDLNTFTITAETESPALSYLVANVATWHYKTYICAAMTQEDTQPITLTYEINDTGSIASGPSNKNFAKNSIIAAIAGAAIAAVVLVIIFIFDDRIKTPDDISKHLGLNILGTIPDFETTRGAK